VNVDPLPLTGERTTPGVPHENYWFQRHVAAYRFAASHTAGMRVLDAGSGEGYGAGFLAGTARSVVGAELEAWVAARAAGLYRDASFVTCDLAMPPWRAGSFDAVVSLQVIEHVPDPSAFLAACARATRPGGVLVLATPNRITFSPDGVVNPFHIVEFSPSELRDAVAAHFDEVEMLGVHHGSRIRMLERIVGPFTARLLKSAPEKWPAWLHAFVRGIRPADFRIASSDLDASLDLIVVARAR
jgi:SAM-dependent methyltransferase